MNQFRVVIHNGRTEGDRQISDEQYHLSDAAEASTLMRSQAKRHKCAGSVFRTVEELVDSVEVEG